MQSTQMRNVHRAHRQPTWRNRTRWFGKVAMVALLLFGDVGLARAFGGNADKSIAPGDSGTTIPTPPSSRRGLLVLSYVGEQYASNGPSDPLWDCRPAACGPLPQKRFQTARRFGLMVGRHIAENYSIAGEFGFATWGLYENYVFASDSPPVHLYQLDFDATAFRHLRWSWGEVIVGPKLGFSLLRGSLFPIDAHSNAPLLGARLGLLIAPTGWVSLGLLADMAYLRAFESNNVLRSLAVAMLF